jgi:Rrf2 family protein
VQIPARAHYALLAMMELAKRQELGKPVALREIVDDQQIPMPFLVQILQQLRTAGLVNSSRGSSGGYFLQRPASQISVLDVVEAVAPNLLAPDLNLAAQTADANTVVELWKQLASRQRELLQELSLTDLIQRVTTVSGSMFYI